jgi:GNAT superfamily N-acetyltransferase
MSKNEKMTVSLKFDHFSQSYLLRAIVGSREVGRLTAVLLSEHMILLGDLRVDEKVETGDAHVSLPVLRWLRPKEKTKSFRGRGIGSMMLEQFLNWCRETKISEVFGSVTQSDLKESPWLLDWYRRHGLEVRPPDKRCIGNAMHMVVWKNEGFHPSGGG